MAGIRNSRRARETRLSIENSLLSLLTVKDLAQVTVKSICQQADINRGTFYIHYQDVQDCLDQIINHFTQGVLDLAKKFQHGATEKAGFIELLKMLQDEQLAAKYILNNAELMQKILQQLQSEIIEKVYDKLDWYINIYYVSGIVGVIREWVNSGEKQSVTEITSVLLHVLHGHAQPTASQNNDSNLTISVNDF